MFLFSHFRDPAKDVTSVKIKIQVEFFSSSAIGMERVKKTYFNKPWQARTQQKIYTFQKVFSES